MTVPKHETDRLLAALTDVSLGGSSLIEAACPFGPHRSGARLNINVEHRPDGRPILLIGCFACDVPGFYANVLHALDPMIDPELLQRHAGRLIRTRERGAGSAAPRPLPKLPDDRQISRWTADLRRSAWEHRARLMERRGLSDELLDEVEIGWDRAEDRFTLPVRDIDGSLLNVRKYSPTLKHHKIRGIADAGTQLYPLSLGPPSGCDPSLLVICEGEFDALVLRQHGIWAVTGTGGKGTWKDEWSEQIVSLGVRWVAVVYDVGAAAATGKVVVSLKKLGLRAWTVDLEFAGESMEDGEDITDLFVKYRWSAGHFRSFVNSQRRRPRRGK